jgi:nucleoside-diphosphate-sugar epimerase
MTLGMNTRVLVTGAFGQIGTELSAALGARYGAENVVVTGRLLPESLNDSDTAEAVDVTDYEAVRAALARHRIGVVYHLAALLSARGEEDPALTWEVNVGGLRNVLEAARESGVRRVFWPSSIAVFGPSTPREGVPQDTVMRPTTIYGVSKVAGELLADYYVRRYGLDVRGVRYPGVVSSESLPGGGTTDYAVEIFYAALERGRSRAFVREDTVLPMIYMPDCIRAALDLMDADAGALVHRNGFNVASMAFSAGDLAQEIARHVTGFTCEYAPDARQAIADSWPRTIDDSAARREWGWAPEYDLARMTADMLRRLRQRGIGSD